MRTSRATWLLVVLTALGAARWGAAAFPGTDLFLPMVGRNPGVSPSQWYTKVWVYNPNAGVVDATFRLLERGRANTAPLTYTGTLQPYETKAYDNAVETMFGKNAWGAIRVTCPERLVVNERFYSITGAAVASAAGEESLAEPGAQLLGAAERGSVGQYFAGIPASFAIGLNQTTEILGVYQTLPTSTSDFRNNFGFVEAAGGSGKVRITAKDGATAAELGFTDYNIHAFEQAQLAFKDVFPAVSTSNARLTVGVISGTARIIAYGTGIANGSQDPTTFEATVLQELGTITGVTARQGLTGGGTSGNVPLDVGAGQGIAVDADTVSIADLGVTTAKLAGGAVTIPKLATVAPPLANPGQVPDRALVAPSVLTSDGASMYWGPRFEGDITGVATAGGSGLTGGVDAGVANLAIATGGITDAMLAPSVTGSFLNTSSTTQTKAGTLILNGTAEVGVYATGPYAGGGFLGETYGVVGLGKEAGGRFVNSNSSGEARVAYGDYGIGASGDAAGGSFFDSNDSGQALVGVGNIGIDASGSFAGGYFHSPSGGQAHVGGVDGINASGAKGGIFSGSIGVDAEGSSTGGYFHSPSGGQAHVGGVDGINASGATGGLFRGLGNYGIDAEGSYVGGYFHCSSAGGGALVAGVDGINASGAKGGIFSCTTGSGYAEVASGNYMIRGSGGSFIVQNHPVEKDRVIVYAAPEGDEVATYTRGTGRLTNGEARISLGETFQWVTNPDIGLTAHLTPVGDWSDLYVAQKSTTELVVRSHGGSPNAAFDYIVYGLRIGFEESSILQEKQQESYIPSFEDHRERYARYPSLRAYNALERFRGMEASVRGVAESALDLSRATALKDAIHEYDPATDPPVDTLFGFGFQPGSGEAAQAVMLPSVPVPTSAGAAAPPAFGHPDQRAAQPVGAPGSAVPFEPRPVFSSFPASEAVEAGDVLVMDPAHPGSVARCSSASDPRVVGIATAAVTARAGTASHEGAEVPPLMAVAMFGVASCKVDATSSPIEVGDLLVASATPGHAMRAAAPQPGTVLGKALEPLASGTGVLKVLVLFR